MCIVYILHITMTSMEIVIGLKINLVKYIFYQTTIDFQMGLRMLQKEKKKNWSFAGQSIQ